MWLWRSGRGARALSLSLSYTHAHTATGCVVRSCVHVYHVTSFDIGKDGATV